MGIILWTIFGALVGWIASLVMKSGSGLVSNIVVGIVGAVVSGYVMSLFGFGGVDGFNLYSFVIAVLGACALIAVVRAVR